MGPVKGGRSIRSRCQLGRAELVSVRMTCVRINRTWESDGCGACVHAVSSTKERFQVARASSAGEAVC